MDRNTKDMVKVTVGYFLVFFAIMLAYRYYEATVVKHVSFEFDLVQNLAIPTFAGVVGGITKKFNSMR